MSKRNHDLHLRLNDAEFEKLNNLVKRSGMSRENYLRHIIAGLQPRDLPPRDYHLMMRQVYSCGTALNQIARKAHALNVIDVQKYDEAVKEYHTALARIEEAVIVPERIK